MDVGSLLAPAAEFADRLGQIKAGLLVSTRVEQSGVIDGGRVAAP